MLYILKATEDGEVYEYEYGNLRHALEHYDKEETAMVIEYDNGKEDILIRKINGKECEV